MCMLVLYMFVCVCDVRLMCVCCVCVRMQVCVHDLVIFLHSRLHDVAIVMCLLCVTESQSSSDTKVVERSKLNLYVICCEYYIPHIDYIRTTYHLLCVYMCCGLYKLHNATYHLQLKY